MKGKGKKSAVLLTAMVLAVLVSASPIVAGEAEVVRSLSTTSPSPGDEFTVTLSISGIQIGGIVETIPDEFTFVSTTHPSDQVKVSGQRIAFAVIDETTEIEYKVVTPSSDIGAFSGFWEDFLNKINGIVQDADSDDEGNDEEEEEEEDLEATPTPVPSSNVTGVSIEAGEEASLTFEGMDLDVLKISIKVDKSVSGVAILVQEAEKPENIPEVFGIPYSYFNITATNLTANVAVTAKIEFKVNKLWIIDNNINETTIKLSRYNENWTVLPTSKLSEDEVSFYFEAETAGFSLFAISGEKKVGASPTPTPEFGETPMPVATLEPEEGASASTPTPTSHALPAKTSAKGRDTGLTTIIAVITATIAVVALVTFAVFRSRRKGGKEE